MQSYSIFAFAKQWQQIAKKKKTQLQIALSIRSYQIEIVADAELNGVFVFKIYMPNLNS